MTIGKFISENHIVHVGTSGFIADFSDYASGGINTDVVNMENYDRCVFILIKGVGAAGTHIVTVESCDDTGPTTPTAVAFDYRICTTPDTWGNVTRASSSGFTTTAGANQLYSIEINSSMLSGTDKFVRLTLVESDGTACDGAILCILSGARYPRETPIGALS